MFECLVSSKQNYLEMIRRCELVAQGVSLEWALRFQKLSQAQAVFLGLQLEGEM